MHRQADDAVADPAELALLQSACEEAARLLRCDGAMTYLVDDATGELRFATGAGIVDRPASRIIRELRLPPGVGMFGRALAEGRVVSTGDYLHDPQFVHAPGADTVVIDVGMQSMVSAPLAAGETVLGAMGVFADMLDAFGPADIALVRVARRACRDGDREPSSSSPISPRSRRPSSGGPRRSARCARSPGG